MKLGLILNDSGTLYLDACKAFMCVVKDHVVAKEGKVTPEVKSCDAYILIGNDVIGRPVKEYVYKSGKPFVVISSSVFEGKAASNYVRMHCNGFTNHMASFPNPNPSRWEMLQQRHNIVNAFEHKEGSKIVIALNAKSSPMLFTNDMEKWLYETVAKLVEVTPDMVYIRHHRKRKLSYNDYYKKLRKDFKGRIKEESDSGLTNHPMNNVRCAITYNSTYSVGSLMKGITNIAMHPGSLVYDITKNDITEEALDWYPEKDALNNWYSVLSNCEWTIEEIKNGAAWEVLLPLLDENKRQNYKWLGHGFS